MSRLSIVLVALVAILISGASSVGQVILNPGFEDDPNLLNPWVVVDWSGGSGSWFVQTSVNSPMSGYPVPAPPEGVQAAMSDQTGPGSHLLYQDITIPANRPGSSFTYALSLDLFVGDRSGGWVVIPTLDPLAGPNQHVRIDIMDPNAPLFDVSGGVWSNLYLTNPVEPLVHGYQRVYFDLTRFAGQTIRLRFAEVDNQLFLQMGIDNLKLARQRVVEITVIPTGDGGPDAFLDVLLSVAGGGGSAGPIVIGDVPLAAVHTVGDIVTGSCQILGGPLGLPTGASFAHVYIYSVGDTVVPEAIVLLDHWMAEYNYGPHEFEFAWDTAGLAPGYYYIHLFFQDGSTETRCIQLIPAS